MTAIRIKKTIDSETLTVPELRPLIGRNVEILVIDEGPGLAGVLPGAGDWDAALNGTQELKDYDYGAQIELDAADMSDAHRHLP